MKPGIINVKNIGELSKASRALLNRAPGAPGIGLVDGVAGTGKTTATNWMANQTPSIYVRAIALWTPAAMLGAMLRELRLPAGGSCAGMVERIVEGIGRNRVTIWIDEADYIARNTRLIETLRDLHDMCGVPVILIGEPELVERLSHLRRFTSRIAQHVSFKPLDLEDTTLISEKLCEVRIEADLLEHIFRTTGGNTRNIVVSLANAEQQARAQGLQTIGLAQLQRKTLFTGGGEVGRLRVVGGQS